MSDVDFTADQIVLDYVFELKDHQEMCLQSTIKITRENIIVIIMLLISENKLKPE